VLGLAAGFSLNFSIVSDNGYGKPNFTDDDRRTVVWRLPSTSIRLQWTKFGDGMFMGVTYGQSDKKVRLNNRNLGTSLRSNPVEANLEVGVMVALKVVAAAA
jgi:hypothetical protein